MTAPLGWWPSLTEVRHTAGTQEWEHLCLDSVLTALPEMLFSTSCEGTLPRIIKVLDFQTVHMEPLGVRTQQSVCHRNNCSCLQALERRHIQWRWFKGSQRPKETKEKGCSKAKAMPHRTAFDDNTPPKLTWKQNSKDYYSKTIHWLDKQKCLTTFLKPDLDTKNPTLKIYQFFVQFPSNQQAGVCITENAK